MRSTFSFLALAVFMLVSLAACNLPSANTPNPAATLQAITTVQAATLQALQTQAVGTLTPPALPTLGFPTLPPLGSTTPAPAVNTATPYTYCDWAAYVKDVTIPDGTVFSPGAQFTKTWRLQNIGTCTWSPSYNLVFSSGDRMSGTTASSLSATVYPGQSVDVSINLSAPADEGKHRGYWLLRNASGLVFGLGGSAQEPFYVDIKVVGSMTTVFDFAESYCEADWRSGAGDLGCPGNEGSKHGYVIQLDNPQLENGSIYHGQGILTVPEKVQDGYLEGHYQAFEPFAVKQGDRFRSIINCQYLATGCNVIFRLAYQIGNNSPKTFWQYTEAYEGQYYIVDVDLRQLAGNDVKFILSVLANGSADADKPLWVAPRIDRPSNLVPASTPTPTKTRKPTKTATGAPTKTPTTALTVTPTVTLTPVATSTPTVTPTATPTS